VIAKFLVNESGQPTNQFILLTHTDNKQKHH